MLWTGLILGVVAAWLFLEGRTARPDGALTLKVHPYRKMLLMISPTKTESTFQASMEIPADGLEDYLSRHPDCSITEVVVCALMRIFEEVPEMNRFVSGGRLYDRHLISVSFSAKRKKGDAASKVGIVNLAHRHSLPLGDVSRVVKERIGTQRSGDKTYADREYDLFSMVPHGLLRKAPSLLSRLDLYGLLPSRFIENDPLFCSAFVANLGSIGMKAGHHHLFEWGNCPIFLTLGEVKWAPVASREKVTSQRVLPIRITYDERIDDGLTARKGLRLLEEYIGSPSHLEDPCAQQKDHE